MGMQDYISASEAASFTGVSTQTLQRFAEAGYLQIESDADGVPLFSRAELIDVFGLLPDGSIADESVAVVERTERESTIDGIIKGGAFVAVTPSSVSASTTTETPLADIPDSALHRAEVIVPLPREAEINDEESVTDAPQSLSNISLPPTDERDIRKLEREIGKISTINKMQEKLLEARESEIRDLKAERAWLRSRIEKLEEKSDRDQLLLLSETQVIRKLVVLQEKKSLVRAALDWLGITSPITAPQQTIELKAQPESNAQATASSVNAQSVASDK